MRRQRQQQRRRSRPATRSPATCIPALMASSTILAAVTISARPTPAAMAAAPTSLPAMSIATGTGDAMANPRTILGAMIRNESGGRNIPNVHQGTSSGQAQGYVQITTGTWRDFAPRAGVDLAKYPTPMKAADGSPVPWEIQSKVAGIIPLKRWDESTIAKMRATGKP